MDKAKVEENVIDIECIDTFDTDDVIIIPDEVERGDPEYSSASVPISDDAPLKTGNILAQLFNLVAQAREKSFWKLDDKEISSLNKTCPKILPQTIIKHAGIIGCALSLLGIIIKRLKLEREDSLDPEIVPYNKVPDVEESKSLTGGRMS